MGKSGDNRSLWFRHFKSVLRLFVRKPKFVYLGKNMEASKHSFKQPRGCVAPLILELYGHHPFSLLRHI